MGLIGNNESRNRNTLRESLNVQKTGQSRGKEFSMVIDTSKPCKDRIKGYIEQIGNPYCYLDNGVVVEIGYANTGVSLQEQLVAYASSIDQDFGNLR